MSNNGSVYFVIKLGYINYILIVFLINNEAFADLGLQHLSIKTPTRFDHQGFHQLDQVKSSRYQMQVSADVEYSLTGEANSGLKVVSLIGSGESFTSQWSTIYDFETNEQSPLDLSMRQLYLHYLGQKGRLSIGVIPPVKNYVSNTSMDGDGWIRGARVVLYVGKDGELEGVTGAVDHLNNPSVFQAPTKWNYHEFEWTQYWSKGFRTELGALLLQKANITRGELRYGSMGWGNMHYEWSGELLYDFKVKRYAYDIMLIVKKDLYRLKLEYSLIDEDFGTLGRLVNDYFSLGAVQMAALDGPLIWDNLKWFTRFYHSEDVYRSMVGISYFIELNR